MTDEETLGIGSEPEDSFLDLGNLDDIPDLHTVPDSDQELRLVTFEKREKQGGKGPFLFTEFEIVGDPVAKILRHVFMLPTARDTERQTMNRKRAIKYFYKAFDIPTSESIVYKDYIGNTGWAKVTEETDPKYGKQNRISRFGGEENV